MATVYKVEIVSHWINYTEKELERMLNEAIKEKMKEHRNEVDVKVKSRK